MRPLTRTTLGALGALALGLVLVPAPAQSAADVTPPVLKTPIKASFTVGSQIPFGVVPDCGNGEPWDLRMTLVENFKWTGSDNSGRVLYDVVENPEGDYVQLPDGSFFVGKAQTSYNEAPGSNSDQFCGGGNNSIYQWDVTARDPAGNTTTHQVYGGRIRLTQDNNLADLADYAVQSQINYTGSWGLASCTCWSQGSVHKTTAKNAAATITVTPSIDRSGTKITHVGLVMHKGPGRGKLKVYVDDVLNAALDTYAPSEQPRTVVWQTAVDATYRGFATIKIVNQATAGRPRIDLDAVLTN